MPASAEGDKETHVDPGKSLNDLRRLECGECRPGQVFKLPAPAGGDKETHDQHASASSRSHPDEDGASLTVTILEKQAASLIPGSNSQSQHASANSRSHSIDGDGAGSLISGSNRQSEHASASSWSNWDRDGGSEIEEADHAFWGGPFCTDCGAKEAACTC